MFDIIIDKKLLFDKVLNNVMIYIKFVNALFFVISRVIMFGKKKKNRPEISGPTNFEHRVHTGFDQHQGTYVGLPSQWASIVNPAAADRPRPIIDPVGTTDVIPMKVFIPMLLSLADSQPAHCVFKRLY